MSTGGFKACPLYAWSLISIFGVGAEAGLLTTRKAAPNAVLHPPIQLDDTISRSPLIDLAKSGQLRIIGKVLGTSPSGTVVDVRVTTADGLSHEISTATSGGVFQCSYPR
ncbi:MAG: hypothetical protein JO353_08690, partial [Phycisphaerae bacterium]|nr:hypothetical protein [Phycisphaerae bacterium]